MNKIELRNKTVIVTGAAGFIGSNLVLELLRTQESVQIIGIDNMNDYYDVSIKEWRLAEIEKEIAKHALLAELQALKAERAKAETTPAKNGDTNGESDNDPFKS